MKRSWDPSGAVEYQKFQNTTVLKQPLLRPLPAACGVTCVTARPQLLSLQHLILQLSHDGTGVGSPRGFRELMLGPNGFTPPPPWGTVVGEEGV